MARSLFNCFGKRSSSSSSKDDNPNHNTNIATADLTAEESRRCGPVVVELFASQGCATSPEAELFLSRIGRGDFNLEMPVVLLAYHVDYWDYMGWKDPFGSSLWTVKQKAYVESLNLDTMFTPQIVVQGRTQCVGNQLDAVLDCIKSAARFAAPSFQDRIFIPPAKKTLETGRINKPNGGLPSYKSYDREAGFSKKPRSWVAKRAHLETWDLSRKCQEREPASQRESISLATFERPTPESLQVSLLGSLKSKVDDNGANVMIALYECGLVTDITTGENKGKMLANDYVVRKVEKLCSVKDITAKKTISGTVTFSLWDGFNSSKCGVALFVETGSHQICGSQNFKLPEKL
ncbi:putative dynein light chain LC6, flagellar outer arm-like [Capsicum annuum]|nr:putative dynein light chain LC6, flagellar outer arm-like [Capsicum annuum]